MRKIKVGVVGMGVRGVWIAQMAREGAETELTAIADMDPRMLKIAAEACPGVPTFPSGEDLVREADVEAVVIATSDRFHARNAREALLNGKHVLIEKPMAQSFADLEEIARLQQATGLVVGTFLELRHSALWQRVKAIVQSGEIGDVLAASVVEHVGRDKGQFFGRKRGRSRETMVSLVLQKGVHALDLVNWYVGAPPARVGAMGRLAFFGGQAPPDKRCRDCAERETCVYEHGHTYALQGVVVDHDDDHCVWSEACDLEDVTLVTVEYTSGVVAAYNEVHFAPYYATHMTLYGSKSQLDVEVNYDVGECWVQVTERHTRHERRERPSADAGHGGADPALLEDFARAVREGREPLSDLRAGYESAQIGIATRQSLDTREFVRLKLLDDLVTR